VATPLFDSTVPSQEAPKLVPGHPPGPWSGKIFKNERRTLSMLGFEQTSDSGILFEPWPWMTVSSKSIIASHEPNAYPVSDNAIFSYSRRYRRGGKSRCQRHRRDESSECSHETHDYRIQSATIIRVRERMSGMAEACKDRGYYSSNERTRTKVRKGRDTHTVTT
jgi:hypothetical protein